ncbi:uncharacterized protein [Watersipora subatra]|uniref:uncharacterized protein n=1 Tax=Watersipora subatra TaxID=2589382 RepID=UPI00355BBAF2
MGLLREYFISYKHQSFILIFDDLSSLMDNGESEEVQKFLNFLLKAKKEYSLKVKVVVTSQVELKPVGGEDEKKTTKSLQLSSLDENISKKLLHQDKKVRLDEKQEEMFLKECGGHPFTLYVVSEMLSAGVDISNDLQDIASIRAHSKTDELFQKALNRLGEQQQKVLLACSLFDSDVEVEVLHRLLGEMGSRTHFRKKITAEFSIRFWLSFKSVANEKEWISKARRTTLVKAYHPLVKEFLRRLFSRIITFGSNSIYSEQYNQLHLVLPMIKKRFITHQVSVLIKIGKDCLQNPQKACQDFLRQKVNIKVAFAHMVDMKVPELLLATHLHEEENQCYFRSLEEILYIFLSLHEYHDSFDDKLLESLKSLKQICAEKNCDAAYQALMHTLYMLILMLEKNWTELDSVVNGNFSEAFSISDENLLNFNDAMSFYIQGKLYTSSPHYEKLEDVFEKRNKLLAESLERLDTFPRSLNDPCKYFAVQIMIVQAEAEWKRTLDFESIRKARGICERAEEYARHAVILKPWAALETASYLKIEGVKHVRTGHEKSNEKAEELYKRAVKVVTDVLAEYKRRRMETSTAGAKTYLKLAIINTCLGNCLMRDESSTDERKREEQFQRAGEHYREAFESLELATRAFTVLNSASKLDLVKSITLKAEALQQLVIALNKVKPSKDTDAIRTGEINRCEKMILQALIKAYNYFLTDPNHCDLKPGGPSYKRIHGIIGVLEKHAPEQVEQVTKQLEIIEKNFERKKAKQPLEEVDTEATLRELETVEEKTTHDIV